jgi:hypothetical protein
MALTKAKILAAKDFKLSAALPVPEWGGDVYIRTISGAERDRFEEAYSEHKMKAFRVRFLVLTLCDEAGERLFGDDDTDGLSQKSSSVINRLFDKAWEHNAFTEASVEALGNDSPIDQNASSTST